MFWLRLIKIITLREHIRSKTRAAEMFAGLLTSLGGVGMLLAAIGLYGVMSYAVAQRTREIGIRMSLGARAPDVLEMIIRLGMRLTLAGLAIGLIAALTIASPLSHTCGSPFTDHGYLWSRLSGCFLFFCLAFFCLVFFSHSQPQFIKRLSVRQRAGSER